MITVKIECPCGTKFAFDADESMVLAAGVIHCPNCGADAADAANSQLLAARTLPSSEAVAAPSTATPAVQPVAPAREMEETESPATGSRRVHLPYEHSRTPTKSERRIKRNREEARRRRPYLAIGAVVLAALVTFLVWYRFLGIVPKAVLDVEFNRAERPLVPRLLDHREMLLVRNRDVSLVKVPDRTPIWQQSFGNVTNFDDGTPNYMEVSARVDRPLPEIRIASNSFWIVWPDRIVDLDRMTGTPKISVELPETHPEILLGEKLLLVAKTPSGTNAPAFDVYPLAGGEKENLAAPLAPTHVEQVLVPDHDTVVALETRVLESNIITNKLSTGPKVMTAAGVEKSVDQNFDRVLDNTHTAGQSLNAAMTLVDELNHRYDAAEPDETYEDRSLYEVVVRRIRGGSSTWKGRITGTPRFFPLASVDVVAGDSGFKVIDKSGSLKWEAPLSYPLSARAAATAGFYEPDFRRVGNFDAYDVQNGLRYRFPFVERDDRLYAYDQGVLAAFDLTSGEVKWRVTSVGIRKILFDRDGALYAATTQDGPETLKRPRPLRRTPPIDEIMKIDPRSGSVLWHAPYLGTDLFISGKFVYSEWVGENALNHAAAIASASEAVPSFGFTRIEPATGKVMWRREYSGVPDTLDVRNNWILIQFPRRLQLLKFFSL